jgi:hypothetical protein
MKIELTREEMDILVASLSEWAAKVENGTKTTPVELGSEGYLNRASRRSEAEALIRRLRVARNL